MGETAEQGNAIEFVMCSLTQREIEFLAGLRRSWWRLYCREFARLLRDNALQDVPRELRRSFRQESPG